MKNAAPFSLPLRGFLLVGKKKWYCVVVKKGLLQSLLFGSLCMGLLSAGILHHEAKATETEAIGNYSTNASTYYSSITATSGKPLLGQLHDLITSTHRYYTSYADNGANGYQKQTDLYYDESGVAQSGYIYEFYSGVKWPNAWAPTSGSTSGGYNREHVWCQSQSIPKNSSSQLWGETGGGSDMHHLRPVEVRLNSTRNNNLYGEIGSQRESNKKYAKFGTNEYYAHGGYLYEGTFEPLDSKKGDIARILFYTYTHYNSYSVNAVFGGNATTNGNYGVSSYFATTELPITNIVRASSESAAWSLLLKWDHDDPIDDIERRRNEQVAKYQGNRNPFIDDSRYAPAIWGDTPVVEPSTVTGVTLNKSSLSLDLAGTTTETLTATVQGTNNPSQTVNWSSSNTSVATVNSDGKVTAKAVGIAVIKATSDQDSSFDASCTVTITDSTPTPVDPPDPSEEPTPKGVTFTASEQGYADQEKVSSLSIYSKNGDSITASLDKGTNTTYPAYYNAGSSIRLYAKGTMTITSSSAPIIKISFTFGSGDNTNAITANKGEFETDTWTGSETSITFTIGGTKSHRRFASITVYYYDAEAFAYEFMETIGCDATGQNAPTGNWTALGNKFNALFVEERQLLGNAEADISGTLLERMAARYDFIVGKYVSYTDFMSRNLGPTDGALSVRGKDNSKSSVLFLAGLLGLGGLGLIGCFFFRKKRIR